MVAFISWLITRAVRVRTGIDTTIVLLLLAMMVAMLVGPAYLYLTQLSFDVGDVAIWEIAVFMMVGMMPIGVLLFAKFWMLNDPERTTQLPLTNILSHTTGLRLSYIFLLLLSEFLMGWTFNLATGLVRLSAGYSFGIIASEIDYSLTTYWFVFTMVAEMGFTLFVLRKALRPDLLAILVIQAVVMLLTPTAVPLAAWENYTVYLEAAVMGGLIIFAFSYLRRKEERGKSTLVYLGLFIVANAIMMAGFLAWLLNGETLFLALSLVVETVIYFDAVLTGAGLGMTCQPEVVRSTVGPVPSPVSLPPNSK